MHKINKCYGKVAADMGFHAHMVDTCGETHAKRNRCECEYAEHANNGMQATEETQRIAIIRLNVRR